VNASTVRARKRMRSLLIEELIIAKSNLHHSL
jgi:hypothetical protein